MRGNEIWRNIWTSENVKFHFWILLLVSQSSPGRTALIQVDSTDKEIVFVTSSMKDMLRYRRDIRSLPDITAISFPFKEDAVHMKLHRNYNVDSFPVYVWRDGTAQRVMSSQLDHKKSYAFYQCTEHNAVLMVTRTGRPEAPSVEGLFTHEGQQYYIAPDEAESGDQRQEPLKVSRHAVRPINHTVTYDMGAKISTFTNDIPNGSKQTRFRRQTGTKRLFEVELLTVVDLSVYRFWYLRTTGPTVEDRHAQTRELITQYYAFLINAIDLRYQNVKEDDMAIRVLYSGLLIVANSTWTESIKTSDTDGTERVDASVALEAFVNWLKSTSGLPARDHAMLFTAYSLTRMGGEFAGLAYDRSICTELSASIVENKFDFQGVLTSAHELGHSLGADHDGAGNADSCSSADRYIMAPSASSSNDKATVQNPWNFSPCSVDGFRSRIAVIDRDNINCLTSRTSTIDPSTNDQYLVKLAGQTYDVDKQCANKLGVYSYFCRSNYNSTSLEDLCSGLYCFDPYIEDAGCLASYPARGTSCGNKKWCIDGLCQADNQAPILDESCPFGDSPGVVKDNKTCAELVQEDTTKCYVEQFRTVCCETCASIHTGVDGCEYGDKNTQCETIASYLCNQDNVQQICCQKCPLLKNVSQAGCEYGEHPNCPTRDPSTCYYDTHCCITCPKIHDPSNPTCAFGDRNTNQCPTIRSAQCYNSDNFNACCATCPTYRDEKAVGCEYGDRIIGCSNINTASCYNSTIANDCCKTCFDRAIPDDLNLGCQYGDKDQRCSSLETRFCYVYEDVCCQRCRTLRDLSSPGCEYGDRAENCGLLNTRKYDCYDATVATTCCKTCATLQDNVAPGCEYGDKNPESCTAAEPFHCYNTAILSACCGTCSGLKISNKSGCEYGDRKGGCTLQHCNDPLLRASDCCDTCWGFVPQQLTTPTVSRKPTTKITTTTTPITKAATTSPKTTTKATTKVATASPKTTTKATTKIATTSPKTTTKATTKVATAGPKTTTKATTKVATTSPKTTTKATTKIATTSPKTTTKAATKAATTSPKSTTKVTKKATSKAEETIASTTSPVTILTDKPSSPTDTVTKSSTLGTTSDTTTAAAFTFKPEYAIGIAGGALLLAAIVAVVCCICRRKGSARKHDMPTNDYSNYQMWSVAPSLGYTELRHVSKGNVQNGGQRPQIIEKPAAMMNGRSNNASNGGPRHAPQGEQGDHSTNKSP